ncbi:MAG: hypothetical protein QGG26_17255, partial [Candidatus Undinarchaeales archaeon]|nr:hypothetical protein [Candidatus Undinarchaeales archaeon]
GICEDACHRDPCSVCEGRCPRVLGDASECHDTCGRVCDRAPPEPSGPDPITLCRDQCRGQGDAEACMQFCIKRHERVAGPDEPDSSTGPDPISQCRDKCRTASDINGCMQSCISG